MSIIIRIVVKRTAWVGEDRDLERARADFQLAADDADGLSVFELATDDDRRVVIANQAISRRSSGAMDLLEVPREVVARLGPIVPTRVGAVLVAADELHRSLPWEQSQLDALAELAFTSNAPVVRWAPAAVKAAVSVVDPQSIDDPQRRAFVERCR